ncbi:hypothetical protein GCM10023189_45500 [Nibrella saemangeumensis]|uniref:Outer membrane protein TolC n=1 Tax=Nibrella saemangeumensis TaxID=1084526 RepID=A0ABP8NCV0_9BACT
MVEESYPRIQQYEDNIQALQGKAEGARSLMAPQISVGLNRFPYRTAVLKEMDLPMNQAGVMVTAEQMITNPVKRTLKRDYLLSLTQIERAKASWTKNELRMQTKTYYFQRYVAERKVRILAESEQSLRLLLSTARQNYRYNQTDLSQVFKVEAKLSELKTMQLMQESAVVQATIGLNTLMNRPPQTAFQIDTLLVLPTSSFTPQPLLIDRRSDVLAMSHTIQSMELSRQVMASSRKPDFGVRVEHMQMLSMPNQVSVMGMITLPLAPWSSPMFKADVKSMQFDISAMQREKETMVLMAQQMLAEKIAMLHYENAQLQAYQSEILPAYQKNFDASLIAYRQNTGSLFVLLDAWDMLLMKRLTYLDKQLSVLLVQAGMDYETEQP